MDNAELLTIIKGQMAHTIKADDTFEAGYRDLLNSYNQEPYGNEEDGRSQVVASDHYDTVESDMPSLARIFLGPNKILHFESFNEADEEEARQKTEYADYLIRKQPESFKTIFDALKEPGFSKISVLKYYSEEKTKVHYVRYRGVSIDELTLFMSDLEQEKNVESVKIESKEEIGEQTFNVAVKVTRKQKKIRIVNVPVENFGLTKNASNLQDAPLAFDECYKTKGDLIAEGYDRKLVKDLPIVGKTSEQMEQIRAADQGGYNPQTGYHWTNEEVKIEYLYPLVDWDDDGIPERRMITKCSDVVLDNEPYDRVPYAVFVQIPMPHVLIGKSRGEYAANSQKIKTAVERGILDNIYAHSRPRMGVDDSAGSIDGGSVDLDDLSNHGIGDIVRTDGPPGEKLFPIIEPYIGSEALQIVQYLDARKSNALGVQASNQGLNSDEFYKETATRFEGVQDNGAAKIELVARCYAEIGFRELYEGVIWTAQHYQDSETEIMVLGKPLIVDPRKWKHEHHATSEVGLGAGDSEDAINNISAVFATQMSLKDDPRFAGLVDAKKIYTTLQDLTRALGKSDPSRYYNDPDIPQEQMQAMLEMAILENSQLKQVMQQMENPLENPALISAQADMLKEQNKRDIEMAKLEQKTQIDNEKLQQQMAEAIAQLEARYTEMELKYQQNVPGSRV